MTAQLDLVPAVEAYFDALEQADRDRALALVEGLLADGADPVSVLQDVICAAQLQVGRRWQTTAWTVAREHAATAISDAAVHAVVLHAARERDAEAAPRGRVVVACVDQEWHALPARVVAEVLSLNGWSVVFLGASTPAEQLAAYLHDVAPDAVALSCSLATGLPRVRLLIEAAHAAGVPVMVGGAAFGPDARVAWRLGADGWAPAARDAVTALADLPAARPVLPPLEHEGSEAYADLSARHGELLAESMTLLGAAFPPMADYDRRQIERTREDLGHIIDFLAAALFADEPAIFHRFTTWLQEVLTARGVEPHGLRVGYETIAALLGGTPAARRLLLDAAERLPPDPSEHGPA